MSRLNSEVATILRWRVIYHLPLSSASLLKLQERQFESTFYYVSKGD